jgi:hypothetical protein
VKSHEAGVPDVPWLLWVAPGACHASHQAPIDLIDHDAEVFAKGWDGGSSGPALGIVWPGAGDRAARHRVAAPQPVGADGYRHR